MRRRALKAAQWIGFVLSIPIQTHSLNARSPDFGKPFITVAVIDTGADLLHPDLRGSLWVNPGESGLDNKGREKASNQIDDDGNGWVDDVHGWNFAGDDSDLTDRSGHGTHISGIIAKVARHEAANAPRPVRIMILKYFDPRTPEVNSISTTVAAIRYAVRMGADVINYSAGGSTPNPAERKAIEEANEAGVLLVAAAGNESSSNDKKGFYPASYEVSNVIAVTAHDADFQILASSNYGAASVDVAAPGLRILSSLPGRKSGVMTGTSQATAFVSAAAALYFAKYADLHDPQTLLKALLFTGQRAPALAGKTRNGTALDIDKFLATRGHGLDVSDVIAVNTTAHHPSHYAAGFEPDPSRPSSLP